MLVQSVHDKQQIAIFQAAQDKQMLRRTLNAWTERVVEIKTHEFEVAERYNAILVADAFDRWKNAQKRKADLRGLMESFIDVKNEGEHGGCRPSTNDAELLRRTLVTWSVRARKSADLKRRLEDYSIQHDESLLSESFAKWRSLKRERDLKPIEQEVALRHEDALMFTAFDKWVAGSRLLPAVQFDKRRVQKSRLAMWVKALERRRELKRVADEKDRRLMGEFTRSATLY